MGFKTIDLDAPDGYKRYNRMKEKNSVKAAFEDEKLVETLAPRPEEKEEVKEEVKEPEPTPVTDIPIVKHGVVTGVSQLRVRTKPEGDIQYLISEKSVVKILDEMEGWYKVETAPGRTGWVMKSYIKVYTEGG